MSTERAEFIGAYLLDKYMRAESIYNGSGSVQSLPNDAADEAAAADDTVDDDMQTSGAQVVFARAAVGFRVMCVCVCVHRHRSPPAIRVGVCVCIISFVFIKATGAGGRQN